MAHRYTSLRCMAHWYATRYSAEHQYTTRNMAPVAHNSLGNYSPGTAFVCVSSGTQLFKQVSPQLSLPYKGLCYSCSIENHDAIEFISLVFFNKAIHYMHMGRKVALVRSAQSIQAADSLPSNVERASRVHALIDAFGLNDKLDIIEPEPLDNDALTIFHSEEYIDCLFAIDSDSEYSYGSNKSDEDDEKDRQQRFGLVHDCALFEGVEEHVRYAAGGTVAAANILVDGQVQIAIHWEGGRHHSQRSKAAGFCYVNDVVLGILALQKRFSRVLYIDLDLHHGDGVQDAFLYSSRVMTLSLHHYDRGFYPNSGGEISEGRGNGAGYSVNVPLQRGTNDSSFIHVFSAVANKVLTAFDPEVIVVQCGCDGLAGDPHKIFNLTSNAFACSIKTVLGWERPALLLGGGGYSLPECARCWTRLTAIACGYDIAPEADVPEHVFLNEYAPGFDMLTDVMLIEDSNTNAYLDSIVQAVQAALPNQS